MIKTAHASSLEKSKLQIKNAKKVKNNSRLKERRKQEAMTPEELLDYLTKKNTKTLKERASLITWDFEARQLPLIGKQHKLEVLSSRLLEIESTQEAGAAKEIEKITRCINAIKQ